MKIGIVLNGRKTAAEIAELAKLAERNRISHLWLSGGSRTKDHFVRLTVAAASTETITLGPVAISPFEMHPVRVGLSLLTLAEASRGRARIVLGGGGDLAKTLRVPLRNKAEAVGETVDIIRKLSGGGVLDYTGKLFKVKGLFSPWTNLPTPPLYVGANRKKMLTAAAQKADGVMFSDMPPDNAGALVERVRAELLRAKRDPGRFKFSNWFVWNVQETMAEAERISQRYLGFRLYYVRDVAASLGLDQATVEGLEEMQPRMIRAIFEGTEPELPSREVTSLLVDHLTITGSKKDLGKSIETLYRFEKVGLNEIALAVEGDPVASIKLLGERVVPELDIDKPLRSNERTGL